MRNIDACALFLVFGKNLGQLSVHFSRVHKHVALKVVFKAAEIKVGRSHGAEFVVNYDGFAMQHAAVV